MANVIDLKGKKFNKWVVLKYYGKDKSGHSLWLCKCECGTIRQVIGKDLRSRKSKSCGCYQIEVIKKLRTKHSCSGYTETSEYKSWCDMKARCLNPKNKGYHNYGGRGISICKKWINNFALFLKDMGKKPSIKHSLERKENNGNYEPNNCMWATRRIQSRNKRNNRWYEYNGEKLILADWAIKFGVKFSTLDSKIKNKSFKLAYEFYMNKKSKQLQQRILPA